MKYYSLKLIVLLLLMPIYNVCFGEGITELINQSDFTTKAQTENPILLDLITGDKLNKDEKISILKARFIQIDDQSIKPEHAPSGAIVLGNKRYHLIANNSLYSAPSYSPPDFSYIVGIKEEISSLRKLVEKQSQVIISLYAEIEEIKKVVHHE